MGDTGAATEVRVTLYFFLKNLATFFAHRYHYRYRFLLLSLGCHLLQGGVSPFYLSDLVVSPLFFVNLPTKFFPSGAPGAVRPPPAPPLLTPLNHHHHVLCHS